MMRIASLSFSFSVSIAYPSFSRHYKQLFIGIFSKIAELQLTYL